MINISRLINIRNVKNLCQQQIRSLESKYTTISRELFEFSSLPAAHLSHNCFANLLFFVVAV